MTPLLRLLGADASHGLLTGQIVFSAGSAQPAHQRAVDEQAGDHQHIGRCLRLEGDGNQAEAGGVLVREQSGGGRLLPLNKRGQI